MVVVLRAASLPRTRVLASFVDDPARLSAVSSHLVTKLHDAVLVSLDLRQMEGDVSVDLVEERDPITDQDRQDRTANFVC